MPCLIANGRKEECKDSVSGIDSVYFINFGLLAAPTYSSATSDEITTLGPIVPATATSLYKYELKGANSFETSITSSRENGTTFFTQTLTIQLKRLTKEFHDNFKNLAYGRPHIVVHTRTNQYFIMGLKEGADLNTGTISTGAQYGDFNGYSLTFEANEVVPANFLVCANELALKQTVFGTALLPANIVTS